ncbi:hypothetical protein KM043_015678 [Ampulex compressa]|nr:hypothetical protein KM043_015678 [Ampulex compressa]
MEQIFDLSLEEVHVLLSVMKEKLMFQEEHIQITMIEQISDLFKKASLSDQEAFLEQLIVCDVICALCDVLRNSNGHLLSSILEFFELTNKHKQFYENYVAMNVVDSILKLAYCKINIQEKKQESLQTLIKSICNILLSAVEFRVNFEVVCVPYEILMFLKSLNIESLDNQALQYTVTTLLNIILEHATLTEERDKGTMLHVCLEALRAMNHIIEYSDDESMIIFAMDALCKTCGCGTG